MLRSTFLKRCALIQTRMQVKKALVCKYYVNEVDDIQKTYTVRTADDIYKHFNAIKRADKRFKHFLLIIRTEKVKAGETRETITNREGAKKETIIPRFDFVTTAVLSCGRHSISAWSILPWNEIKRPAFFPEQIGGSLNTYGSRYAMQNLFAISDTDVDPDILVNKNTVKEWKRRQIIKEEQDAKTEKILQGAGVDMSKIPATKKRACFDCLDGKSREELFKLACQLFAEPQDCFKYFGVANKREFLERDPNFIKIGIENKQEEAKKEKEA